MTTPTQTTEEHLSTADFAAAADRRTPPEAPVEPKPMDRPDSERGATERAETGVQATLDRPDGGPRPTMARADGVQRAPLFAGNEAEGFRGRWSDVQAGFVDEPRRAVEQADGLVAEVMQRLAQVFADERRKLEQQWDRGDEMDTEELRQALQRYRSFFDRLLTL